MISIVAAEARHINRIAKNIAEIDELECRMLGHSPKQALRLGLRMSSICGTALLDDQPIAMFGVVPENLIEGKGSAWLLLTKKGRQQHRALVVLGKQITEILHKEAEILHNHVHASNDRAIRWLEYLGFTVEPTAELHGQPMRYFHRCATQ